MDPAADSDEKLNESFDLFDDDNEEHVRPNISASTPAKGSGKANMEYTDIFEASTSCNTQDQNIMNESQTIQIDRSLSLSDRDESFDRQISCKRHKTELNDLSRDKMFKRESSTNFSSKITNSVLVKSETKSTCNPARSGSELDIESAYDIACETNKKSHSHMPDSQISDKTLKTDTSLEKPSNESLLYTCPFCNTQEPNLSDLERHIASSHADMDDCATGVWKWVCPLCDVDMGTESDLNIHVASTHTELDNQGGLFSCPLCGVNHASDTDLQAHVQTHKDDSTHYCVGVNDNNDLALGGGVTSPVLTCPLCGVTLGDADLLQSHIDVYHTEEDGGGGPHAEAAVVTLTCPVCGLELGDEALLSSHVESHFNTLHKPKENSLFTAASGKGKGGSSKTSKKKSSNINKENIPVSSKSSRSDSPQSSGSSSSLTVRDTQSYRRQFEQSLERAVMRGEISVADFHEQRASMARNDLRGVDDGSSRVDGLIERLSRLYRQQARPGQLVYMCSPTSHFSGSHGDRGWGCGYRNLQMLLSCLVTQPEYSSKLASCGLTDQSAIPSIPKVQQLIEAAWRSGFDPDGRQQLKGKLVGTQKWIGATEIVAVLSSLGVRCRLADFHAPTSPDGTHPRLVEWVTDYFTTRQNRFTPPLYLQHQGHSRTIVGVENDRGTTRLLLFDPASRSEHLTDLISHGGDLAWKSLRTFRRTVAAFKARQYQIVAVDGIMTYAEQEESKIIKSERIS